MLGHDSKSETGKVLSFSVKCHKLEEFYQLLSWDVEEFTSHGALSYYIEGCCCIQRLEPIGLAKIAHTPCHQHMGIFQQ